MLLPLPSKDAQERLLGHLGTGTPPQLGRREQPVLCPSEGPTL